MPVVAVDAMPPFGGYRIISNYKNNNHQSMNSTIVSKSSGNSTSAKKYVYKDFRELAQALENKSNISDAAARKNERNGGSLYYDIVHASRYLGRTEAALRLFFWENGLKPDAGDSKNPLFSAQSLDLILAYGYLFDYAKVWRLTGHNDQADILRREAELVFGISSPADQANYFGVRP
jgi:hypothetical protein